MHAVELAPQPRLHATALPAWCYTDAAIPARERAQVFDRGWQLVAHACRLREPGDHVVADLAGLPVLAVRGDDGAIRVLHNVCRHRAGPLAECDGRGARSLRCRYHGWTYGLDGVLRSAPEMAAAEGFVVDDVRLPRLQVQVWQGLVFACAGDPAAPFDALVDGIAARLGPDHPLERYGGHRPVAYEAACNWKVYVDNYLEGYHVPHVHPALNRMLDYRGYRTTLSRWHSLQSSALESGGDGPWADGEALYWWLWPNTMLNVLPGRLQTNRVVPLGIDRCRIEFDTYYPVGGDAADAGADADFSDLVQHEDLDICAAVQRGLGSGSYLPGRLNPLREDGVWHFQELWREAMRAER